MAFTKSQQQDAAPPRETALPQIAVPADRTSPLRQPFVPIPIGSSHRRKALVAGLLGVVALAGIALVLVGRSRQSAVAPPPVPAAPKPAPAPQRVAALGRLEPAGDVRKLAAPITGIGGSPRIIELLVEEGDQVRQGQLLALFDNGPILKAERQLLSSRIANLREQVEIQEREISRYRQLNQNGAIPAAELETREVDLVELKGSLREAQDQLTRTEADLINTELRAPISGTVLRVRARVGERPGDEGIVELGASQRMEAVAEVYESDIGRIRKGQGATITSENGGFQDSIPAKVIRISPQVRQREVLSTDPTGDVDARVVEVRLALDPAYAQTVRTLAGIKTIIRFNP